MSALAHVGGNAAASTHKWAARATEEWTFTTIAMTSTDRRLILDCFERAFLAAFPDYARVTDVVLPQGGYAFAATLATGIRTFVILVAWSDQPRFSIECATAADGGPLPARLSIGGRDAIISSLASGGRLRLGKLIDGKDRWWTVGAARRSLLAITDEEIRSGALTPAPLKHNDVQPAIDDAIFQLLTHWKPLCASL